MNRLTLDDLLADPDAFQNADAAALDGTEYQFDEPEHPLETSLHEVIK